MKVLGKRVLVKPESSATQTESGIYVPEGSLDTRFSKGEVWEIGKEVLDIVVGDVVLYSKYAGTELVSEGKTFVILNEDDVLAIVHSYDQIEE